MDSTQKSLYDRLVIAGLSNEEAEEIVKSQQDAVDVDRLTKAMEGIKEAFTADEEEEKDTETLELFEQNDNIVDAVTKGADALLAEQRSQYDALSKAVTALTEEVIELRGAVSNSQDVVQKSLSSAQQALNEPVLRKSVGTVEVIPTPAEAAEHASNAPLLIEKAINEIQLTQTSDSRRSELRKAISMLECGLSPAEVATTYSIAN